jgi:hypothetical protein
MARRRYARFGWSVIPAAVWLLLAVVLTFLPSWARGANPASEVEAQIAAGEFGPALAAAAAVNDPAQRDKLLGSIAAAQAGAGGRRAAFDTAADISSDLERKAALGSLAASSQNGGKQRGARGGASMADFDSLIELMTTTIKPDSWDDVGGPGAIDQFAGGVYVDSAGLLRKLPATSDASLLAVHRAGMDAATTGNPHRAATLRKVSLTRLEREVQLLAAQGREASEAMQTLAGLKRIKYVLVYPDTGDIVLAGPAGDWRRDTEGRFVDEKGSPVLNLDDLVVTLRNAYGESGVFGCSIDPRKNNLAAAKAVTEKWSKQPLKSVAQREKWLAELRGAMGRQDIRVHGIDPRSRAGRVLIEADYRMKLVGLGLEEGVLGVSSYFQSIELDKDGNPPALNPLVRWYFTLNYDSLSTTDGRDAFELRGPGVKVLSESEMLTERGDRVHTGESDEPTRRFAESFTKHLDQLAAKYPVYAELRNVFDLALASAVIHSHDLPGQAGWHMTHFGPGGDYVLELGPAANEVESVMNHRLIGGKHVIAAVSGGVKVDAGELASREAVKTDTYGLMAGERRASTPKDLPRRAWWWD